MLAPRKVIASALALSGLLGCVHQQTPPAPPPSSTAVAPGAGASASPSPAPPAPAAAGPAASPGPAQGAATPPPPAAAAPRSAQPPNPPARTASGTAASSTAAQAPAPKRAPSAAPGPATPAPAATTTSTTTAAAPAGPALDLGSLEQRLRDTHAIGVFTKLSLKNQVDDLLGQFRSFYSGQGGLTLAGLRRSYELLLMKVVTLLQDDDPGLATAVSSSRESIWAILSDRNRFNRL